MVALYAIRLLHPELNVATTIARLEDPIREAHGTDPGYQYDIPLPLLGEGLLRQPRFEKRQELPFSI